jgi:hypothetical protein
MTREELEAIRKRCEAATPGPWSEDDGNIFSEELSAQRHEAIVRRLAGSKEPHPDGGLGQPMGFIASTTQEQPNFDADADFIAHARTDVPKLLAIAGAAMRLAERGSPAGYCCATFAASTKPWHSPDCPWLALEKALEA